MPDEVIFFFRMPTQRRTRKQMRMIIAGDTAIVNRNRNTAPAGAFEEIPEHAISISDPSAYGYEGGMAVGTPNPSTYSITFHREYLRGNANLDRLREAVTLYEKESGGTLFLGADEGSVVFTTSNAIWILTDEGNPANRDALGDPTITEYIGVQRVVPGATGDMRIGRGTSITFELVHIVTAIFGTILMDWVSKAARSFVTYTAPWKSQKYGDVVDVLFDLDDIRWYISQRADRTNGASASFYNWPGLWEAIQHCCNGVLWSYLRYSGGLGTWIMHSNSMADKAGPWDHWTFYKQNYGANHQRGTALARTEFGLMGAIRANPTDPPFAGMYYPGQDSLQGAFERLGDFLKNATEAACARATIEFTSAVGVKFAFLRLLDASTSIELSLDTILVDSVGNRTIKYNVSSDVVRGVKVARRGKQGNDDKDAWSFLGTTNEGGWNHKMVFDANPSLPDEGEMRGYQSVALGEDPQSTGLFDSFPVGGHHNFWLEVPRYYPWKLYYLDNPLGAAAMQPFRVHENPDIDMGNGTNVNGELATIPAIEWQDGSTGAGWSIPWRKVMRGTIGATIENNGMGLAAYRALNKAFGAVDLTSYDFSAFTSLVKSKHVGQALILPADIDVTTWHATGLLDTGDVLDLPGWCILVNYQPNPKTNIAKITLQGLRKT